MSAPHRLPPRVVDPGAASSPAPPVARPRAQQSLPLLALAWLLVLAGWLLASEVRAQTGSPKIAADLRRVLEAATTPVQTWARDLNGVRHVQVLIVGGSDDAELTALHSAVMAAGGSIDDRYSLVLAPAARLPASKVAAIAARADVQSVSPNRRMARASSTVESVTGTSAVRTTTLGNCAGLQGAGGKGIGIAVLDSGTAWQHLSFKGDGGERRVREAISFTKAGDAVGARVRDWTPGIDDAGTLNPANPSMQTHVATLQTGFGGRNDRNGHGPHVASKAELAGATSLPGQTGLFMPLTRLSAAVGRGETLGQGSAPNEGTVLSEDIVLSEAGMLNPASRREASVTGEP